MPMCNKYLLVKILCLTGLHTIFDFATNDGRIHVAFCFRLLLQHRLCTITLLSVPPRWVRCATALMARYEEINVLLTDYKRRCSPINVCYQPSGFGLKDLTT
ncbi:hypothetical protein N7G274_001042 [Stereocaulon virgatum]|uniref:Secreted protein n=1 Tax=Stereocaulon virgatum TaxID=373712 RepID=A0ABR4AMQ3_9LECA